MLQLFLGQFFFGFEEHLNLHPIDIIFRLESLVNYLWMIPIVILFHLPCSLFVLFIEPLAFVLHVYHYVADWRLLCLLRSSPSFDNNPIPIFYHISLLSIVNRLGLLLVFDAVMLLIAIDILDFDLCLDLWRLRLLYFLDPVLAQRGELIILK